MTQNNRLEKANAARKKIVSTKNTKELFFAARLGVSGVQECQILFRLEEMPETCRRVYLRAMSGKSKAAGVKAYCQICMGWEDFRSGIRNCTDLACPLYPYRPYTKDQDTTTAETKPDNA